MVHKEVGVKKVQKSVHMVFDVMSNPIRPVRLMRKTLVQLTSYGLVSLDPIHCVWSTQYFEEREKRNGMCDNCILLRWGWWAYCLREMVSIWHTWLTGMPLSALHRCTVLREGQNADWKLLLIFTSKATNLAGFLKSKHGAGLAGVQIFHL